MNPTVRSILAILAGLITVPVMITLVEIIGSQMYPQPEVRGLTPQERKEIMAAWMDTLPAGAFLIVLLAWQSGAFAGGAVAAWIAGRWQVTHAAAIGCFVLLASLATMNALPHPGWVIAAGLLLPIPVSILAAMLVTARSPATGLQGPLRPKKK